ncbi:hypothetical protein [Streptomyces sp. 5-10]|uniref:hypothetical protein n=1 Tax=Streptomyces sp. 5-10 TaxID=878925 RepID=UPI00168B7A6F|nr:hypothetical protein [Streptomyces sp. 5-10]MBD3004823.1 hypothetical protein [Streptomyces sp. 5-10]
MTNSSVSGTKNKSNPRSDATWRPPDGAEFEINELPFTKLPDWVLYHEELPWTAKELYLVLRSVVNERSAEARTSAMTVAEMCEQMPRRTVKGKKKLIGASTVREAMTALQVHGALTRTNPEQTHATPRYRFSNEPPKGYEGWLSGYDKNRHRLGRTGCERGCQIPGTHTPEGARNLEGGAENLAPGCQESGGGCQESAPPVGSDLGRPVSKNSFKKKNLQKNLSLKNARAREGSGGEPTTGKTSPEAAAGGREERDSATPDNPAGAEAGGSPRAGGVGETVPDERAGVAAPPVNGSSIPSPEPVVQAYTEAARRASRRLSAASVEKVRRQVAGELSQAPWEPYRDFLAEAVVEMGENGWTDLGKHLGKIRVPREVKVRPWCGECGDPDVMHANYHPRTAMGLRMVGPGFLRPCPVCSPLGRRRAA